MAAVVRMMVRVVLALLCVVATSTLAAAQAAAPIGGSVNQAAINTRWPAVAYDTQNHVYLAVFGSSGVIRGVFVNDDGVRVGNVFDITTGNYAQTPRVAYNSQDGNFLVVWHSTESERPNRAGVRARVVSYPSVSPAAGTVISGTSYSTVWENAPAVAYGQGSNRYMIVWSYYATGTWDLAGTIVDAAGNPAIAEISIATGAAHTEQEPAVGYFPDTDRFVAAWGAYDEAGMFGRGRAQLFTAATGAAATGVVQFAQGLQIRVPDVALNNATGQNFVTWIQPDPSTSPSPFRPFALSLTSAGATSAATGTRLSSTVGAYDANAVAYNQRTTTFFLVTHGSTSQDWGFEIDGNGNPLASAAAVTSTAVPSNGGSYNPRLAASTQEPRWLIGTTANFTSFWTQLIGGTAILPPPGGTTTYRLSVSPTPTGGVVSGGGLQCGTGAATCQATFQSATNVTLTATPDANYTFAGWGGSCSGTDATTTVNVDGIRTCTATFTYTGGGGGPGPIGCTAPPTPVFAATPGPIGGSVAVGSLAARWPAVAYDECRQVYLAVFGSGGTIKGQFLNDEGTPVGGIFDISSGTYGQTPRVAYNSTVGNFLVVWHATESSNPNRTGVRGITVTYPGGTPGPGTVISGTSYSTVWENGPALAYGSGSNRFMVVWSYYSTGSWEVAARIVDATGAPLLSEIALSSGATDTEQEPSVGYFPDTDRFVAAWGAYNEAGRFARGRAQLFAASTGAAATAVVQFAQGTQVRVPDLSLNTVTSQVFISWIQPDPSVSPSPFRPFGLYLSSAGTLSAATGTRLSSSVGAYDANSIAYNPLSGTFFLVTHGSTEQDWGFEIAADGTALRSAAAVTSLSTPLTGAFNPRLAASTRQPRWLIGTVGSFTSVWTQLVGATQPVSTTHSLTIAPVPTGGTVSGGTLLCGTGGATCTDVYNAPASVTLTAAPDGGFLFAGWGGACTGTALTTTVAVQGAVTCSATFTPLAASPSSLRFAATKAGAGGILTAVTDRQTVTVRAASQSTSWTVSADQPWVEITSGSGTGDGQFLVGIINPNNVLGASTNVTANVRITPASGSAATVAVTLTVDLAGGATAAPFGLVDTPLQNAAGVVGAIGVTGWALDDIGVAGVKIYRNCLPFDAPSGCQTIGGVSVVFIGDATFVPGARPDVEAGFPAYPQAYRAGWGYMLLTNMLPHVPTEQHFGGQGPLTLYAIATDLEGRTTVLGRTLADATPTAVTLANETITKPFGAIDTPTQGQTVSGVLTNFGWALTPDNDTVSGPDDIVIPTDGTTVRLFIDGVPRGFVSYNQCRGTVGNPVLPGQYCNDDVSSIFGHATPQPLFTPRAENPTRYRNLDQGRAAIGALLVDTTTLSNGLHTIAWSVMDSQGRTEGIGSRFFTVLNTGVAPDSAIASHPAVSGRRSATHVADRLGAIAIAPVQSRGDAVTVETMPLAPEEVWGRTGFGIDDPLERVAVSEAGTRDIQMPELGRLELHLGAGIEAGYLVANGALRDLPPGSHLDREIGRFTWMPGVGYVGTYRLVFVREGRRTSVVVRVRPEPAPVPGEAVIRMALDTPFSGQVLGKQFVVAGWALDPHATIGSGITGVHVWARRRDAAGAPAFFLGSAALGGERPDVARVFGGQFAAPGFGLTATLTPGVYDITAYVWNRRTLRWEDARTAQVTVR